MKLKSKEIFPTEAREKLVEKLANKETTIKSLALYAYVCDMKHALEAAEEKCFELNKENEELEQYVAHAKNKINELQFQINEWDESDKYDKI